MATYVEVGEVGCRQHQYGCVVSTCTLTGIAYHFITHQHSAAFV